jgi:hypothetical protein
VADEIAGKKLEAWTDFITSEGIPVVMKMSLNALLNGLLSEERQPAGGDAPNFSH